MGGEILSRPTITISHTTGGGQTVFAPNTTTSRPTYNPDKSRRRRKRRLVRRRRGHKKGQSDSHRNDGPRPGRRHPRLHRLR